MRQKSVWALLLTLLMGVAAPALAQLPFGTAATVLKGATVYIDGQAVENCSLVISGKKIKAIGPDVEIPEGADVIDMKGKVIIPALIDASAEIGIADKNTAQSRGRSRGERPHFQVLDEIDPFDRDPFEDALAGGVAYAYLRNDGAQGIGGRGRGILIPSDDSTDVEEMALEGVEALHVRLGIKRGPISRYLELQAFDKQLEAAQKYKDAWKKYREDNEKYLEELKKGDKSPKKDADKKKDKKALSRPELSFDSETPRAPATAAELGHDHDHDHGHEEQEYGDLADQADSLSLPHPWDVWSLRDGSLDPVAIVRERRAAEHHDDPAFPTQWEVQAPQLRRPLTFSGDDTEPQLMPEPQRRSDDPSGVEIFVCAHCGGHLEGQPHVHEEARGFDFWEFALAAPDEKKADDKKKEDKEPKQPKEPKFDPSMEELVRVLEGKLQLRIEVHHAADILNVLELVERRPLRVVLEGLTEAWMVTDELKKSEVPVVLYGDPQAPRSESGESRMEFEIPDGFPPELIHLLIQAQAARAPETADDGRHVEDLAARLSREGVPVAIATSHEATDAAAGLLLAASRAVGQGMDSADALKAVTIRAAQILGIPDLGELKKGNRASFVVLDGDPFSTSTRLQSIYVDGKTHYKKK